MASTSRRERGDLTEVRGDHLVRVVVEAIVEAAITDVRGVDRSERQGGLPVSLGDGSKVAGGLVAHALEYASGSALGERGLRPAKDSDAVDDGGVQQQRDDRQRTRIRSRTRLPMRPLP